MLKTFVVPSCEITAAERLPVTLATLSSSVAVPILTVTPLAMFAAVRFAHTTASIVCAPDRYCPPATVWALELGVIVAAALLLMLPVISVPFTKAFLPDRMSPPRTRAASANSLTRIR